MEQTIVTINGTEAIDYVLSIHPHSKVFESTYTYDCDIPGNVTSESERDMAWMLWNVLLSHNEPENITFKYKGNDFLGMLEEWWEVSIYTGTPGEPSGVGFSNTPD